MAGGNSFLLHRADTGGEPYYLVVSPTHHSKWESSLSNISLTPSTILDETMIHDIIQHHRSSPHNKHFNIYPLDDINDIQSQYPELYL